MTRAIPPIPKRSLAAAVLLGAVALAGCGTSSSSGPVSSPANAAAGTPAGSPSGAAPSAALTPVPTTAGSGSGQQPTQTDTEWGRIWDAIPRSFPRYPGSSESAGIGPASATFDVPADVPTATSWMASGLEAVGFRTTVSGPGEDGSMTLDSVGPAPGCMARTTIAKTGGTTTMTILFGASCPFS